MDSNRDLKAEDGIIIGNVENKSELSNPIARAMVQNFDATLLDFVLSSSPESIHEVGCGEGRVLELIKEAINPAPALRGSDFSKQIITQLQKFGSDEITYVQRSIYDLEPSVDSAELIICCEVLEHLEDPDAALESLKQLDASSYIMSVPREPLWRILNMARLKYVGDLGNTPGHLNHWSSSSFISFLKSHGFNITALRKPFPWTMVKGSFHR